MVHLPRDSGVFWVETRLVEMTPILGLSPPGNPHARSTDSAGNDSAPQLQEEAAIES